MKRVVGVHALVLAASRVLSPVDVALLLGCTGERVVVVELRVVHLDEVHVGLERVQEIFFLSLREVGLGKVSMSGERCVVRIDSRVVLFFEELARLGSIVWRFGRLFRDGRPGLTLRGGVLHLAGLESSFFLLLVVGHHILLFTI